MKKHNIHRSYSLAARKHNASAKQGKVEPRPLNRVRCK